MRIAVTILLGAWLAAPLAAGASVMELAVNGGFEDPPEVGWEQQFNGSGFYLERATDLDHDPDYELKLRTANGHGQALLMQHLPLPALDTVFSATLRSSAYDGSGAWCAAGLRIRYLDAFSAPLGQTFLGSLSPACPWIGDGSFHIVELTGDWQAKSFVVADELALLPEVDAGRVAQLEVSLVVSATNC